MTKGNPKRKVIVFGIFDGIHDGHRDLFRQAKEHGDELVVIVGSNEVAERLKERGPKYSQEQRIEQLKKEELVYDAVRGDEELSSYQVLSELEPDVICIGYDQDELEDDVKKWATREHKEIPVYRLYPHNGDILHTSFLS